MHCRMGEEVRESYFVFFFWWTGAGAGRRSCAVEGLLVISMTAFGLARRLPFSVSVWPLHMDSSLLSGGGYQTTLGRCCRQPFLILCAYSTRMFVSWLDPVCSRA